MDHTIEGENQFVVDLLITLHQEKFSPLGWWRFFGRSWEMSCKTANDNPTLKRSWLHTTLLIGTLAVTIILINFLFEGAEANSQKKSWRATGSRIWNCELAVTA